MRLTLTLTLLAAIAATFTTAQANKSDLRKPVQQWTGVIKDLKLRDVAKSGEIITDAERFEKVWKAWQPKAELPKVDFKTQFVYIVNSSYEPEFLSIYGGPDKWNGSNSNKSPTMIKGGFGWGIGIFDSKGVVELNGKPFPPTKDK